jgi:hypothetical protein
MNGQMRTPQIGLVEYGRVKKAVFTSQRIANLLSNDSTTETFSLTHSDSDSQTFSFLCSFLRGHSILTDEENIIFLET